MMIKVVLTNSILTKLSKIDQNRFALNAVNLPKVTMNRLRKNSKKKSSYASNKIEGNPLTENQAEAVIESDPHKHFLETRARNKKLLSCTWFFGRNGKKGRSIFKRIDFESTVFG